MKTLIAECRRRQVFQVTGLYVLGAWVVLQVASLAFENWGIPTEAMRFIWLGAIAGFPIALLLGWRFNFTGGHIMVTSSAADADDLPLRTADFGILGISVAAILLIAASLAALIQQTATEHIDSEKTQLGRSSGDKLIESRNAATPNAYNLYLEGVELMERWDKEENLEEAIGRFREATNLDPRFALAYSHLANALRIRYVLTKDEASRYDAVESAEEAVRLNPDLAPVQLALGEIHAMLGNLDLAVAAVERAISIDPNAAPANVTIGTLYERQGRLRDAEAFFKKAVALEPENVTVRNSFGNFLLRQNRTEEAADEWRIVIRYAPDHFAAFVNLGAALSNMENHSEAITMYERAIDIRPSAIAYSNLGTEYFFTQRYSQAAKSYRNALEINESDWLIWGNLAFAYLFMDGMEQQADDAFERAIQLAEAAREQRPRDPYLHSDLALYYANAAKADFAQQRLETALTLSPDSGEIRAFAAEVYETLGQREKAIEFVNDAIEHGYAKTKLQRNPQLADLFLDPRAEILP